MQLETAPRGKNKPPSRRFIFATATSSTFFPSQISPSVCSHRRSFFGILAITRPLAACSVLLIGSTFPLQARIKSFCRPRSSEDGVLTNFSCTSCEALRNCASCAAISGCTSSARSFHPAKNKIVTGVSLAGRETTLYNWNTPIANCQCGDGRIRTSEGIASLIR